MYTISNKTIRKTAKDLDTAKKIAKQLSSVFGAVFKIEQHQDVWSINYDK